MGEEKYCAPLLFHRWALCGKPSLAFAAAVVDLIVFKIFLRFPSFINRRNPRHLINNVFMTSRWDNLMDSYYYQVYCTTNTVDWGTQEGFFTVG